MQINDTYVPQVGHLVLHKDGLCNPYLVVWTGADLCELVSHQMGAGTSWTTKKENLTFLADRSAEWQALFQLDTPTP